MTPRRVRGSAKVARASWDGLLVNSRKGAIPSRSKLKPISNRRDEKIPRQVDEYDIAFGKACRVQVLKDELAGDLKPHARRRKEAELRDIHNWFTPRQRRRSFKWQRDFLNAALSIQQQANERLTLVRILADPSVRSILRKHRIRGVAPRRYLSKAGFGLQKPGRPKKKYCANKELPSK